MAIAILVGMILLCALMLIGFTYPQWLWRPLKWMFKGLILFIKYLFREIQIAADHIFSGPTKPRAKGA